MYKEKDNRELIELLERHEKLTFRAQLNLKEELELRNLDINTSKLQETINNKIKEIKNLDYLKDIGFESEKSDKSIKIKRTNKAVYIDLLAILLGIVLCTIGVYGVYGILSLFSNDTDFSIMTMIIKLVTISIGILGIKLLNGINRLIDYSGFEYSNINGQVTLKKRFDTKLIEIQKEESSLRLEKQSEYLSLKLDKYEVFKANSNSITQKMTLSTLANK